MSLKYGYVDIELNNDDDITFEDGDFLFCTHEDAFKQHMKMRILTNPGELILHQGIGAGLEELEGMPNTRETGSYGATKIYNSINFENEEIDASEIIIRPVPTSKDEVTFYTYAEIENAKITQKIFVTVLFKLSNGLLVINKPKVKEEVI